MFLGDAMKSDSAYQNKTRREAYAGLMNVVPEFARGNIFINVIGQREVFVENYQSILSYTEKQLVLRSRYNILRISGNRLCIIYYNDTDLWLTGEILSIVFEACS